MLLKYSFFSTALIPLFVDQLLLLLLNAWSSEIGANIEHVMFQFLLFYNMLLQV